MGERPKRLYELVSLQPTTGVYYNAPGYICGEEVLPGPMTVPQTHRPQPSAADTSPEPEVAHPIICRAHFPADITAQLVSWDNPEGKLTNSDLDLTGIVLHHACMADCFNVCEWTTMSRTDNTAGLWWNRKG